MATVKIRPCLLEECAAVLDLWRKAGVRPSVSDDVEQLTRLLRAHGDLFLVAEQDSRIVGTILGGWDGWRASMYRLAVLPEYRRKGIAKALVQETERLLVARGARRISILVAQEDVSASAFWDALHSSGYVPDPRMKRYVKTL